MNAPNAVRKTLDELQTLAHLKGVDVANLSDVSRSTVSRWSSGQATPTIHTQLVLSDLRYVADRLHEFYTPDEVRLWLYAKNDLLKGYSAMELIHDGRTEEVLQAIDRLAALTYI